VIGNAPDYGLSLKGEKIFHKVSVVTWTAGVREEPVSLWDRGLSGLRKKVIEFVTAKTDYGKLLAGTNDFGICEVPEKHIKIIANIVWNRRLSPESVMTIAPEYQRTFFGDLLGAKVQRNCTEGGPNTKNGGAT
jgi:hypothetical protein